MTAPDPNRIPAALAVLDRIAVDCADLQRRSASMNIELAQVKQLLAPVPAPVSAPVPFPGQQGFTPPPQHFQPQQPPSYPPQPPRPQPAAPRLSSSQIIGRVLAACGVGVTLIGVVLLLVLAAQAGLLRPELRVAGGALFAAALFGAGLLVSRRSGGRVGGVALAATGIAAAYIDAMAASVIYHWLPAPVALVVAGVIAGVGLATARWWNSQSLGVLVMAPLLVLAPIITRGFDFSLIAFMLVLSAAAMWIPIGKNWLAYFGVRTVVSTIPLALAPFATGVAQLPTDLTALLMSCVAINAMLAVGSALLVLGSTRLRLSLIAMVGFAATPIPLSGAVVDPRISAAVLAGFAVLCLGVGVLGGRIPGATDGVRIGWLTLSILATIVALPMAFAAEVVVPTLLAGALGLALASLARPSLSGPSPSRPESASQETFGLAMRIVASGVALIGALALLALCPPWRLVAAADVSVAEGLSSIIAALLAASAAVVLAASWSRSVRQRRNGADVARVVWTIAGLFVVYQFTQLTVMIGLLASGRPSGFLGGHMAATIGWIAVAACLLGYATRVRGSNRALLVGAGLALTAGAVGKLFLFDLATLDGLFRVVAFIVVGVTLLALGAGYARVLDSDRTAVSSRPSV